MVLKMKVVLLPQAEYNCKVSNGQLCSKVEIQIGDKSDNCVILVGKVDGLNENGEVVEIKNLVNKLVGELRG